MEDHHERITLRLKAIWNKRLKYVNLKLALIVVLSLTLGCAINYRRTFTFYSTQNSIKAKYNVFFIESNIKRIHASPKQLCAVESAAKNNPNAQIHFYTFGAQLESRILTGYSNIQLVKLEPDDLFHNTSLQDFWTSKKELLLGSSHSVAHLSDAARIAILLKKGGGVYSDLDTITLRSFALLVARQINGVGRLGERFQPSIGNGILIFGKNRRSFLEKLLENFAQNYQPSVWGANGPTLLASTLQTYCKVNDIYTHLAFKSNVFSNDCDIFIFPQNYFYPINLDEPNNLFTELFEKQISLKELARFRRSFSIHFYGKATTTHKIQPGGKSLFAYFATRHCPITYNFVANNYTNQSLGFY